MGKNVGILPTAICKTVRQYSKGAIPAEDMEKLQEIAEDYHRVKNHVYARYGGTASLCKLYPGYTVQNEMTGSGLRTELAMPSVYFYLAIFDALGDIKSQWTRTKTKLLGLVGRNESLTEEEKHYLRFLLKTPNAFEAVLNGKPVSLPRELQRKYEELSKQTDPEKLRRYLCRQVRKYHIKVRQTKSISGFSITERAYRYADHGIYISTKEARKRIFVPLTDNNRYTSQFYVRLYPENGSIEISVPIHVAVRSHADYRNKVGLAMGMHIMLTASSGNSYGEQFGIRHAEYADWIRSQTISYNHNRADNPGRKKYNAKKNRYKEQMHSYINQELNRFLRTEKLETIYLVKLPSSQTGGAGKRLNHSFNLWQRGYIRSRLLQKCREQSVKVVEVLGKDISNECSSCGAMGKKHNGCFIWPGCGASLEEKVNTARNVLRRGTEGKILNGQE